MFLVTILILSIALNLFLAYMIYKFAKIIIVFEDDLSNALEALTSAYNSVNQILEMKLFFDSEDIRNYVQNAMNEVRISSAKLNKIIENFTQRSKKQYILLEEQENTE